MTRIIVAAVSCLVVLMGAISAGNAYDTRFMNMYQQVGSSNPSLEARYRQLMRKAQIQHAQIEEWQKKARVAERESSRKRQASAAMVQ
ncbi:hypothetical protein [Desulfomonile tiedjei]|uniref:Uncharacterized protein n=1 Tax=Desulfomonile tiedjei (strain ATCC 49306 / DSM 6799 / DCB-1) TaxID=706587 RepID=I4CAZ0_DESTA|nr:hypothetical protein [Desulfomonile tiedjei]AFM26731.1 hypothetical protein Desti_4093 [Desulfomonile tiedjei DSM 6799]